MFQRGPVLYPPLHDWLFVSESPPRQVDKKSGVLEVEKKGVWGS